MCLACRTDRFLMELDDRRTLAYGFAARSNTFNGGIRFNETFTFTVCPVLHSF